MTDLSADAVAAPSDRVPGARRVRWGPWTVGALALGGLLIATGWPAGAGWAYVGGLVLVAAGLAAALRRTWWLAALVVVAVAVVGIGVPWLVIRQAYAVLGVAVDPHVVFESAPIPSDDGLYRVIDEATVTALRPTGQTAWQTELDEPPSQIVPLTGGRALVSGIQHVGLLAADGSIGWSKQQKAETTEAGVGDVLVRRACVDADRTCSWTGIDTKDGSDVWTLQGGLPRAFVPEGRGLWVGAGPYIGPVTTELFGVGTAAGTTEVRAAATGEVVRVLPAGHSAWLVGDLVLDVDFDACTIEAFRGDSSVWSSKVDCALAQQFVPSDSEYGLSGGVVAGDGLWTDPPAGGGTTFVVDLRTGAVRKTGPYDTLSTSFERGDGVVVHQVVGAGVVAELGTDTVTVRNSGDGALLWSTPGASGPATDLQADGTLVGIDRPVRPMLLHEWFAPGDDRQEISVYDARTGALRATMRHDSLFWTVVGDRVLVTYTLSDGSRAGRMIGG